MPRGKKAESGKVNKMEAVRQVIGKHGPGTMPVEIVQFVKEEHGGEISPDMASNYKSAVLKKMGLGSRRKGRRGPKPGWKLAAADGAKTMTRTVGFSFDDLQTVKTLCDRMGAEKVKQLAQVLAK